MKQLQHSVWSLPVAKVGTGVVAAIFVGAAAFGAIQLSGQAFDPSAFLDAGFNRQANPEYNTAYDIDHSEADGEANMQADQEETPQPEQPDLQQVDASSWSQNEGSGSSALSVVEGPASGGTVLGGEGGEGGTPSDNPLTGPVINGDGNGSGGDGTGEGQGGNGDGNQGGGDTPGPIPPTDPDPRPSLPDDMYGNVGWIETHPFPEAGIEPEPDENGAVSVSFAVYTEEYMLEDPDELGMERIYYGMYLDDWKLLCATYFYVTVNDTMYRLENYSDNFKIGAFPEVLTSDTLEVDFFFRLNVNDKWQTERVKYLVHPNKVIVEGWDGTSLKTRYPAVGQEVYLDDVFSSMLPAGTEPGMPLTWVFPGWTDNEGSSALSTTYLPPRKGRIELQPLPLAPVPPEFQVTYQWGNQALVGYTGTSPVCALPEGIQSIDLPFGRTVSAEVVRIPASLRYGAGALVASRAYEVDEGNTTFHMQDGMLFETESGALYGIPTNKETVVIPPGTPLIVFPENNHIKRIEVSDVIEPEYFEALHGAEIAVPADRYIEFLAAWGAHPGDPSNRLVADTGEEFDYVIRDGAAYTTDGSTLVEVLDGAKGTFFVPEGVQVVKEGAFAKCPRVDTVVLPQSVRVLERESLVSEGLTRVLLEGTTPPTVDAETFGTAEAHVRFATYDTYLRSWSEQLGTAAAETLLAADDFTTPTVNGYHLLSLAPRASDGTPNTAANETIILRAPADATQFAPDTLGDIAPTALGAGAFEGCTALSVVELPASVKVIGDDAFAGCTNLEAFFSASPDMIVIGVGSFANCDALRMAAFSAHEGQVADWNDLYSSGFRAFAPYESVGYDEGSPDRYTLIFETMCDDLRLVRGFGGVLLYGYATIYDQLVLLGATSDVGGVVSLEPGTAVIYFNVFKDCANLTSIDDASMADVEEIYDYAFARSGLTDIVISQKVFYMGTGVFESCRALEQVVFEEGLNDEGDLVGLDWVTEDMFVGCTKLTSVTFPSTVLWVDYGIFTNSAVRTVVFTSEEAPILTRPNPTFPFVFSENPPDDFKIELAGVAAGHRDDYIQSWKNSLIARPNGSELTPEEDLRATNLARALFGLPALEALPAPDPPTPLEAATAPEKSAASQEVAPLDEPTSPENPASLNTASGNNETVDPLAPTGVEEENDSTAQDVEPEKDPPERIEQTGKREE
ncbi:leucine-rich repeat domain-containing protein [Eggerthella sp. YY7918]|uniref:leucine-rich repeat domain-containing protein n=1 Tax=Eggerthella sp. (strain YY7918) TaxID=502558 RepID=UPI0013054538|nr:leucine-rich repeat domain-containing protein [Eggerthella sp. YY7918]